MANRIISHQTTHWSTTTLLLSIAVIAGCSTAPDLPPKTFVRIGPSYNQTMPEVEGMGLFVDGAIAYDGVTDRFFDIEDSRAAIVNMTHEAQVELASKGYELAFVEAPFVAGYKEGSAFPVASGRNDAPQRMPAPFQAAEYIDADPVYREALRTMSRRVIAAASNAGKLPTDSLQSDADTKAALAILAAKKKIRYLLVVQGTGVVESGAKQTAQFVGTAVVTAILTLGTVAVVSTNVSYLNSYASLIDLQTAEVVWCNSLKFLRFDPSEPGTYQGALWAHRLLYWLPPRANLEAPPPAAK